MNSRINLAAKHRETLRRGAKRELYGIYFGGFNRAAQFFGFLLV